MRATRPTTGPLVDLAAIEHRIARADAETKQTEITTPTGQSERRYRHLVENSLGLICTHDLEGTVLSVNPAAAQSLGYEPHEGIGKNLREFLAPDTRHLFDTYLEHLRQSGSASGLMRVLGRDGAERVWLYRNVRYDEPGAPPFVLGHAIDITERVAAEAALKQSERALKQAHDGLEDRVRARTAELVRANDALRAETEERRRLENQIRETQRLEALGRFAGGVAHDFNNLLTVIIASAELLAQSVGDDPSRALVEDVRRAGERAADLTRQLLAFGRRQMIVRQPLDLNLVVGRLENMMRRLIGAHIELSLALDPEIPAVRADWGQIEQVVLNLVANARDAMPHGGTLTIGTRSATIDGASILNHPEMAAGRYVVLSVSDTGCGIDAETRPHIFEPFFTTKSPGEGTGLGLATVYGIVSQSGGYIAVESTPAQGTAFNIYMPEGAPLENDRPARVEGAAQPGSGTETILLAEDEEAVRSLVRAALEEHGYTVIDAPNGADALRLFDERAGSVDLLVTDIVMPQMSGRRLHTELSSRQATLKVLFLSGYADEAVASGIVTGPGVGFLQKPFTLDLLTRTVRKLLDAQ
jgi:two-component system cell cycle sensor histidine kinase/response regulator CckA